MFVERPFILLKLYYKGALSRIRSKEKTIYLTFDDGPTPDITPQILDILDRYGVKATFFCVGDNVRHYPDMFEEIKRRGHRVGNHTMNHLSGFNVSTGYYMRNVAKADELIHSDLVRPPYGRVKPSQFRELKKKYRVVLWDVITRDYNPRISPKTVFRIVHWFSRDGSIVVFHDSKKASKNMLPVLPKAIEFYIQHNYKFGLL